MSQIFTNALKFNNGLSIKGRAPIDDRTVWSSMSDLYVDSQNPTSAPMFNKIHDGMLVVINDEKSGTLMVCKDSTPYKPGAAKDVTADNYTEYWSMLGSNIYDEIIKATYFNVEGADDSVETLDKHGNLAAGTKIGTLKQMTISQILQNILFEKAYATQSSSLSVSCSWNNYSTVQEIGSSMPTESNININFNPEVYKCITSAGKNLNTYSLNTLNTANSKKYYNGSTNSTTGGTLMSDTSYPTYVTSGTHYFYVNASYDAYQDAKNSDGTVQKSGYAGTKLTNIISFKGVYKFCSNAAKVYTDLNSAWNDKSTAVSSWDPSSKKYGSLVDGSQKKIYLKWPNATTSAQTFYIYIPTGHTLTKIVAADNNTPAYDLTATATKQSSTTTIATSNGHGTAGIYDVYIVTKATGYTCVEVTID